MFSEKELKVKEFIESTFVPTIHKTLSAADPFMYLRYGGRCCKQIAYLLSLFLDRALPEYEWSAWESTFSDDIEDYPHAWVFGKHKSIKDQNIIMDYGKLENEYSFFLRTVYNEYPSYLQESKDDFPYFLDEEIEDDRRQLKPQGIEAFTQKTFEILYRELDEEMKLKQFVNELSNI